MMAKMLDKEDAVKIASQSEVDPLDYFKIKTMGYTPLCAIAGYDSYKKWLEYSKQEDRSLYDKIVIVPPGGEVPVLQEENASLLAIERDCQGISSRLVKSLLQQGQDVSAFLDPQVLACIEHRNL
jgi:nicotinic acid mononucleotide adenylyltransferase